MRYKGLRHGPCRLPLVVQVDLSGLGWTRMCARTLHLSNCIRGSFSTASGMMCQRSRTLAAGERGALEETLGELTY
jgi:hypothetical protein